jgi:Tol biopolymer transport system component
VYVSDSGGHANLWVMNLATRELRQITYENDPALRVGLPLWSPDGKHIAYFTSLGSSWNYFLIRPDGSDRRVLARGAGWATWSPDGQWLYFSDYPIGTNLRKVPATGGSPVVVRSDNASRVALAPDGGALYYAIELPVVSGGSDLEIRVAQPEDAPSRVLTRIPARRAAPGGGFQPVISPDGQWLALALLDGVTSNLWALSTSTGQLRQLTDFGDQPTFITRRVSWSSDGRFIFAAVGEGDSDVVLLDGLKP